MMRLMIALLFLLNSAHLAGGQSAKPAQVPSPGKAQLTYDKVWRRFTEWYVNDSNPVVQKILYNMERLGCLLN